MNDQTSELALSLRRPDRDQVKICMQCDDDLIPPDHEARNIWAISGRLDLSGFAALIRAREGAGGRNATDPRLLFCLWLYAATQGVGSARELEQLCRESPAYRWLCGGVSVNHHLLSDFRVDHQQTLDGLLTEVLASLVDKDLVTVHRISQDGTRVRACAGGSSFKGEKRLERLVEEAKAHVAELSKLLDDPEHSAGLSARKQAAQRRAARDRVRRLEAAMAQLPEVQSRRQKRIDQAGDGQHAKQVKQSKSRVSVTDPAARKMKMGNGGYSPAYNVQLAVDTRSRAIVGVAVCNEGADSANLSEPMRNQVESRTGRKVREHLMDGGYAVLDDIERAAEQEVAIYCPPKPPRNTDKRADAYQPAKGDSPAVAAWRARMGTPESQEIYKERASTVETTNADLKTHRGLNAIGLVKGMGKALCVALWSVLAYNLMHFGSHMM